MAQENLTGRWILYSTILEGIETRIEVKREIIIITFKKGQKYSMSFYKPKKGRLGVYYVIDSKGPEILKTVDKNGKILKQRKIKHKGVYRIDKEEIVFTSRHKESRVWHQLQNNDLLVKWQEAVKQGNEIEFKFKKH